MNIDYDYLATIPDLHPRATSVRWGCTFDGRQMALVGYLTEGNGEWNRVKGSMEVRQGDEVVVFYAALLPGCTITRAGRVLDGISRALKVNSLNLYMEGTLGRNEVFLRALKKGTNHKVKLFREGAGIWFDQIEVIASIADDQETGQITVAPEFKSRPERVLLDEATGVIEEDVRMSPLQSAFVYGVGYWSCREQRKKFAMGAGPRFW